jgi:hypothetical protein
MKKRPLDQIGRARGATKNIAISTTFLCASLALCVHAQTKPNTAADNRNLQVQAVAPSSARSNQRIALVIGNAAYKEAPLTNPVNDARAIAGALQESGFTVILRENTDQRGMLAALREFGDKLRAGGTGLFYYAGHGMQIKGRNYLIPVGANVDREDEVAYSAVDAQAVLDKMESAGNGTNIMILDACRNNPFTRASRSGQSGLAQMEAPVGTLVAFATSPGAVASDGTGANGLYTQHLLTAMRQNGSKVEDVFKQVRANVRRDSQGKQVPWESTSLEGDFYFKGGAASASAPAVDSNAAVENALWDAVKNTTLPIELRAYLNRFPNGRYASDARARLAQLQPAPMTASAPVAPAWPGAPSTTKEQQAESPQSSASNTRSDDQAAVDRRTEELLASLAKVPSTIPVTQPNRPPQAASSLASNKAGFTVGDRWRYQVVDKFKGEVVRNYGLTVDSIAANGDMSWNGGNILTSPEGNWRRDLNSEWSYRDYSNQLEWIPKELREGYKQDVQFTVSAKRANSNDPFTEEFKGTLTVKGREKVKVPAGEFLAWRIESNTSFNGTQINGSGRWYGFNYFVGWYVPELRNFVARDHEHRVGSQVPTRNRVELTSFSVRGAENLAQR